MANVESTGGSGGPREITPREKALYTEEYRHGIDLFQRALQQYAKSNDMHQKGEFKDVMDDMMEVLNETARALKQEQLKEYNKKIESDYASYRDTPSTENQKKLEQDLDQAKKKTT